MLSDDNDRVLPFYTVLYDPTRECSVQTECRTWNSFDDLHFRYVVGNSSLDLWMTSGLTLKFGLKRQCIVIYKNSVL